MSNIKNLIAELCPNGVEFKTLGEIAEIKRGIRVVRNQLEKIGKYAVYQNSMTPLGYYEKFNCNANTTFVISAGAAGEIGYSDKNFWAADDCFCINCEKNLLNKFIYYFLLTQKNLIEKNVRRASIPRLPRNVIENILIPIPPLPVQAEIVRILDTFTELILELTKELSMRKKQYEYYASKLFLETNAENYSMGELAKFVYGFTDTAKDTGDARFIRITDINESGYLKETDKKYITLTDEAKKSVLHKGDLIMARTGATFGKTLYFDSDFPSVYASFLIKIIPCERLLAKYYWHFTKTSLYWEQANKLVTKGGQQQFNTPALKKVKIPVPPLDEQERIVNILDKFDRLCNDLSEGIPAEIALRKKQYEYYRDLLLTFEEEYF